MYAFHLTEMGAYLGFVLGASGQWTVSRGHRWRFGELSWFCHIHDACHLLAAEQKTVTKSVQPYPLVQIIKASSMLRMPSAVRSCNCLLPVCRNVVLDKRRSAKLVAR